MNSFGLFLFIPMNKMGSMEKLRRRHFRLIDHVNLDFRRYLIEELPWNDRLLGIKGARGVGKTTMLLQYLKANYGLDNSALYISLDDLYFSDHDLLDLVEYFVQQGGKHLFVDEVHKYDNWSIVLKNIHDSFPDLKLTFTGSSLLEILNARTDLSRRAAVFSMQGLSFREYLQASFGLVFPTFKLEEILNRHLELSSLVSKEFQVLPAFEQYLKLGYFPFFDQEETLYHKRLEEIIRFIIQIEIPELRGTDFRITRKIEQLIQVISQSVPFKPNVSSLSRKISITRKTLLEHLHYLSDANVLRMLHRDSKGTSLLQKPEKLFLENTNYMYALHDTTPNIGNVRETFFLNQVSNRHQISYPDKGDFLVDNQYLIEIGGRKKTVQQVVDHHAGYVAADGIVNGYQNKIPLWLFGFLY